jgi:predicted dehydrogenase
MRRRDLLAIVPSAIAVTATSRVFASLCPDAKPRIKIGQIGVGHGHASKLSVYRDSPDYEVVGIVDPASRKEFAEYPGGILFELGGHIMDLVIAILGKPQSVASFHRHSAAIDDGLLDNMLCVLEYPKATATVKSTAIEVEGFDRRHLVVCGTEGTFHIQPLDNPSARVSLSRDRGEYKKGTQEIKFPKYFRYVGDAADMAQVIRGERSPDFLLEHDLTVQAILLRACGQKDD